MSENSKLSLTMKAGRDFDAPWLVLHPESVEEGRLLLEQVVDTGLDLLLANASKELQAKYVLAAAGAGPSQVSSQPAPQAPPQPPQQPAQQQAPAQTGYVQGSKYPPCEHGAYIWKDFTSKAGRHIKGWFCPGQGKTACPADFRD